ncbi:MAG TPA: EAL domain-containing protein [Casimicrobiaceae bacterium]|nr:EAL domain-containing protein [Casimicrobiaceae bacterium]
MATILIVDDRAANREFLVALLGYHRHRLIEAGDGAVALALARVERPDLVISDILMPTMDGYEFVRRLRTDPALAATPVIFYTAHYHGPEARKLARDCGVAYTLSKPARQEDLLEIVAQALHTGEPEKVAPPPDFDREHLQILTDKLSEQVERLRRINTRFAALNDVNLQLASERDPRRLLESVCHAARELTGAKYALLMVAGKTGAGNTELATSGLEAESVTRMGRPSWREGAVRTALEAGKAMRLRNPGGDASAVGLSLQDLPVFSLLAAPITSLEHNYGWIALADKLGAKEFTEDDEVLVAALGAQLGRFYENGSLYAAMQQHADRLRESERRFSDMLGNVKLASVMLDRDARITYCNDFLLELTGWRREDVLGQDWLETFIPPGRDDVRRVFDALIADDASASHHENEILTRSGKQRLMRWNNTVLRAPSGEAIGTASIGEDITERALAEEKIQRLNRMHAVLSGINTTIVRAQDRQELFLEACRIAVEAGQFKLAWIGTIDREAGKLTPVASHGIGADYLQLMPLGLDALDASSYGLAGRAIKERRAMVSNDMAGDPRILVSADAARRGLRSVAAFPLSAAEEVVGVLALYSGEVGFFDADEMKLLLELAGDISFALDHRSKGERLDYLAYYDTLTGLANPTLFRERVTQLLTIAAAEPHKLAVALLDIDHFRTINDSLGRQGGDELLKQLAGRLGRESGNLSTVARFGPARFAIVFHDIGHESNVAHKLEELNRRCLGDVFLVDGHEIRISGKSGIAVYPSDGSDTETLLQNAEFALRKAKASGEIRVFYTQEMTQIIAERITMENRLRLALERGEFVLHYQPKVDLKTREILGVEALLRWQSPDLGLVPPLKFISILEQTGMIVDVGAWVLRRAVLDHKDWLRDNLAAPRVAVNVSAIQLRHRDFVDLVRKTLAEGAREPGLDVEITESVIMDDVASAIEKLKTIRDLGVSIAIDDFGTGYSSLGYLARLPVHALKIDRSFIMTMVDNPDTMTLVSAVISLAHSLRLKVIAEGVETEDQAKVLRLLRCDEMQGYLISRPVPVQELRALLAPALAE